MNALQVKKLLDQKYLEYAQASFLEHDPVQIPHRYTQLQDVEISGLWAATLAWGQRKTIINNALKVLQLMDDAPYDFTLNHSQNDLKPFEKFVHRTFNGEDSLYFIKVLKTYYSSNNTLETAFLPEQGEQYLHNAIVRFRDKLFSYHAPGRTAKHISNPAQGAAAKRLHMYLRWMVRKDHSGIDFGLWKRISPALLSCPLDVHTGNIARQLGLMQRKQNDLRALNELDTSLRSFDPQDPVKYDYALFGLGVSKAWEHL